MFGLPCNVDTARRQTSGRRTGCTDILRIAVGSMLRTWMGARGHRCGVLISRFSVYHEALGAYA